MVQYLVAYRIVVLDRRESLSFLQTVWPASILPGFCGLAMEAMAFLDGLSPHLLQSSSTCFGLESGSVGVNGSFELFPAG